MILIEDINNFIKSNSKKPAYTCTHYANNPYICANAPLSHVVVPQGQITMPSDIVQPPLVQTIVQPPPSELQSVNYNQITPYINSNSKTFQPELTTKSGQAIATASASSSKPVDYDHSQVVYVGPVNVINPQITPTEQEDSDVHRQISEYYKKQAEYNEQLRRALEKSGCGNGTIGTFFKKAAKVFGIALLAVLAIKYRAKIPFIKY